MLCHHCATLHDDRVRVAVALRHSTRWSGLEVLPDIVCLAGASVSRPLEWAWLSRVHRSWRPWVIAGARCAFGPHYVCIGCSPPRVSVTVRLSHVELCVWCRLPLCYFEGLLPCIPVQPPRGGSLTEMKGAVLRYRTMTRHLWAVNGGAARRFRRRQVILLRSAQEQVIQVRTLRDFRAILEYVRVRGLWPAAVTSPESQVLALRGLDDLRAHVR